MHLGKICSGLEYRDKFILVQSYYMFCRHLNYWLHYTTIVRGTVVWTGEKWIFIVQQTDTYVLRRYNERSFSSSSFLRWFSFFFSSRFNLIKNYSLSLSLLFSCHHESCSLAGTRTNEVKAESWHKKTCFSRNQPHVQTKKDSS